MCAILPCPSRGRTCGRRRCLPEGLRVCHACMHACCVRSTCTELLSILPRMSRLTTLALCEFQAPAAALLGALAGLPHLTHLSLHSLDDYYLSGERGERRGGGRRWE